MMPVYFDNVEATRPKGLKRTEFTIRQRFYIADELLTHTDPKITRKVIARHGVNVCSALEAIKTLKEYEEKE